MSKHIIDETEYCQRQAFIERTIDNAKEMIAYGRLARANQIMLDALEKLKKGEEK